MSVASVLAQLKEQPPAGHRWLHISNPCPMCGNTGRNQHRLTTCPVCHGEDHMPIEEKAA